MRKLAWCWNWRTVAVGMLAVPVLCGPMTQAQQPGGTASQYPGGAASSVAPAGLAQPPFDRPPAAQSIPGATSFGAAPSADVFIVRPDTSANINLTAPGVPMRFSFGSAEQAPQQDVLKKYGETADEAQRATLSQQLRQLVDQEFTDRQNSRQADLQRLEEQLNRLRAIHQRRENEREQIVNDRVQQLLRNADGVGWGDDSRHDSRPGWTPADSPPFGYAPPALSVLGSPQPPGAVLPIKPHLPSPATAPSPLIGAPSPNSDLRPPAPGIPD